MNKLMIYLMIYDAVGRTAPATLGVIDIPYSASHNCLNQTNLVIL